jgi:hypothetical protein
VRQKAAVQKKKARFAGFSLFHALIAAKGLAGFFMLAFSLFAGSCFPCHGAYTI